MKRIIIASVGSLAIVAGVVSVASSTSGRLGTERPEPENVFSRPASPAAQVAFSALGSDELKQRGRADAAVLRKGGFRVDDMLSALGVPASEVRSADVRRGTLLVAAGSGGLCTIYVSGKGAGSGCKSEADAATGRGLSVYGCLESGDMAVYGLVPDGVETVKMTLRDGSTVEVAPSDNALVYPIESATEDGQLPQRVGWVRDGEVVDEPLPMPAAARC